MNTAVKNAVLMDQFIGLIKKMMGVWIALNARLLWQGYLQLREFNLRVMDGLVKANE